MVARFSHEAAWIQGSMGLAFRSFCQPNLKRDPSGAEPETDALTRCGICATEFLHRVAHSKRKSLSYAEYSESHKHVIVSKDLNGIIRS